MESLNVYQITFNCARALIDVDYFGSRFFARRSPLLPPPDLIVLCLQEIAPIAHSFLGGNLLLPYFRRFFEAVNKASTSQYESIAVRHVGMTAIMILAKSDVSPAIQPDSFAGVGVGQWQMGNKGAVGVRIVVGDESPARLTFVSAHLAPMEDAFLRRNQDWKDILAGLVFIPATSNGSRRSGEQQPLLENEEIHTQAGQESTMFQTHVPVFFAGDLNYRTSDTAPPPNGYETFPQASNSNESVFEVWQKRDQLTRERLSRSTLHQLDELPVSFPPTYKYVSGDARDWSKDGSEPSYYKWAKHRYPSWCDRILFSSHLNQSPSPFEANDYTALPLLPSSDHRPVALSFSLNLKPFIAGKDHIMEVRTPVQANPLWRSHRASARRLEVVVGGAAYLTLTREGNLLLLASTVGAVGGWLILSSMIST